jgi:hypothetical protein
LPETGMGYQLVDIFLKDGRIYKKITVYNSEEIELSANYEDLKIEEINKIKLSAG